MAFSPPEQQEQHPAHDISADPLQLICDMMPVMTWISDPEQGLYFVNKAWKNFTGIGSGEDADEAWYRSLHADDVPQWLRVYTYSLDKQAAFTVELRLQAKNGEYRWMSCSGQPWYAIGRIFKGYIGSCIDIQDQKLNEEALERKVSDRTAELQEANAILLQRNQELEQFAYVTSHDLQEPLRKIRIFTDILQKQDQLTGQEKDRKESLSRIRSSADRMAQLIRDLLSYSRLGVAGNPFVPTDLNTVVLHALRDFDLLIEETRARVHVMSLPIIEAVPLQMNQLFVNLIGNALKFRRQGVSPLLRIHSMELTEVERGRHPNLDPGETYIKVVVEDNGIGFQQEYVDKIFVIFQRLNAKENFPGTGIGLAICRKIVQNHRGEIYAFGTENDGASFHIILPRHHLKG